MYIYTTRRRMQPQQPTIHTYTYTDACVCIYLYIYIYIYINIYTRHADGCKRSSRRARHAAHMHALRTASRRGAQRRCLSACYDCRLHPYCQVCVLVWVCVWMCVWMWVSLRVRLWVWVCVRVCVCCIYRCHG